MQLISKTRAYLKTPSCVQQKNFFFRILNRASAIGALSHDMLSAPLVLQIESDGVNRLSTFHGREIWTNHD